MVGWHEKINNETMYYERLTVSKRVAVTGMAGISPLGNDWQTIRAHLGSYRNAITRMTEWADYDGLNTQLGAPAAAFELSSRFNRKSMRSILTTAIGGAAIYVNVALCMYFMAIWPDMSPQQRYELSLMALSWISAQGSAVVTFWFVARGNAEGRAK